MMTPYSIDSPQAVARLLALAVTVDGVPADAELALLDERGALRGLGLSRDDFDDVMDDLCAQLRAIGPEDIAGYRSLSAAQVRALLDEIRDPRLQRELAGLFFEVFCADHLLTRAESILFWDALEHWDLQFKDVARDKSLPPVLRVGGLKSLGLVQ